MTESQQPAPDCICGHDRDSHVYHEGPCRPGFVCQVGCLEYCPAQPPPREAKYRREWSDREAGFRWRVYVNGEAVAWCLTQWGAKRVARRYKAGYPLPSEAAKARRRWHHV